MDFKFDFRWIQLAFVTLFQIYISINIQLSHPYRIKLEINIFYSALIRLFYLVVFFVTTYKGKIGQVNDTKFDPEAAFTLKIAISF